MSLVEASLLARPSAGNAFSFGLEAVDRRFSGGGLAFGAHQVVGGPGDRSGANLLASLWLARMFAIWPDRPALWVQERDALQENGVLYGPGLHALGVDPGRLALVTTRDGAEALRVVDRAARSGAVLSVIGELRGGARKLDLPASQRLNLRGQENSTLVILLTPDLQAASAAKSRWQVRTAPSRAPRRWLGPPTLDLELVRNRHGSLGRWTLEWSSDDTVFRSGTTLCTPVVCLSGDRQAAPASWGEREEALGGGADAEVRLSAHSR